MTSAAIYARVSSAGQKKDQTIGSQTAALRAHAATSRLEVPEGWVFEDEGHSGATLVRPALERLRDLAAQGCVDVVLVWSPDRLARKFAYQALLVEEFARAGVRVEFIKNGPRGDSPEDQLLVQFQGMFAEYEKAQLMVRYRRGKAYRAQAGSVNVLSGAPFGYRYIRKAPDSAARYEVIEHEAVLVAEMFRRYADDGATIADLARWLAAAGAVTRTGKHRWDRSVVWGMLRNPAYAGRAVFGKTQVIQEQPGLNRVARLQGRTTPRPVKTVDRPREEWTEIAVPAIVDQDTFARVQQRLEDNKKFATRGSKAPSLLQGLAACAACGYGYYRTSTRTARRKIYYYRCLGMQVEFLDRPMSSDPHDQLLLQIRGAVAEYERTLIAERMRRGRQASCGRARCCRGPARRSGTGWTPSGPVMRRGPGGARRGGAGRAAVRLVPAAAGHRVPGGQVADRAGSGDPDGQAALDRGQRARHLAQPGLYRPGADQPYPGGAGPPPQVGAAPGRAGPKPCPAAAGGLDRGAGPADSHARRPSPGAGDAGCHPASPHRAQVTRMTICCAR